MTCWYPADYLQEESNEEVKHALHESGSKHVQQAQRGAVFQAVAVGYLPPQVSNAVHQFVCKLATHVHVTRHLFSKSNVSHVSQGILVLFNDGTYAVSMLLGRQRSQLMLQLLEMKHIDCLSDECADMIPGLDSIATSKQ